MTTHTRLYRPALLTLCALGLPLAGADGCGSGGFAWGDAPRPAAYDDARIVEAESELARHDVRAAQRAYTDVLADGESEATSTAAAGLGLTQLMLLPGAPSVRGVLTDHLGADNSGFDAQALIWSEEGVLYWLSRGTRWEDDGEFQGVRSLVEALLPWTPARLESTAAFCGGLERPLGELLADTDAVADSLENVEQGMLSAALAADFEYLYVPAAVFHDDDLSLSLGSPELHALTGALALTRAALHYASAWRMDTSLDALCGPRWQAVADDPDDPEHVPGYTVDDYAWRNLDARFGREVARAARLTRSRDAARQALERLAAAFTLAADSPHATTFDRDAASPSDLRAAADVLTALSGALDAPTALPGSSPATSVDLSHLFSPDAGLDPEVSWFKRDADSGAWTVSDDALQTFLVDPSFTPSFQVDGGERPALTADPAAVLDALVGVTLSDFESLYLSTR